MFHRTGSRTFAASHGSGTPCGFHNNGTATNSAPASKLGNMVSTHKPHRSLTCSQYKLLFTNQVTHLHRGRAAQHREPGKNLVPSNGHNVAHLLAHLQHSGSTARLIQHEPAQGAVGSEFEHVQVSRERLDRARAEIRMYWTFCVPPDVRSIENARSSGRTTAVECAACSPTTVYASYAIAHTTKSTPRCMQLCLRAVQW